MRRGIILLLLAVLGLSGCATGGGAPPQTQLQIREFQTRIYETKDTRLVMKALLNVLQDEGFIVKEANSDLGFLTGSREVDVEDKGKAFVSRLVHGANARWDKNSIIEVTANVSEHGEQTRVRVNFQAKTLNNMGLVSKIRPMGDEAYYQEFFAKVDKGIFIEKEKL
jgi:uncharacterized protein (DUF1786 family)